MKSIWASLSAYLPFICINGRNDHMKKIDIKYFFGFEYYFAGEDEAVDIEISDELYSWLEKSYTDSGTVELVSILEDMERDEVSYDELEQLIEKLRENLVEVQKANKSNIDPETGEVFDFTELNIEMEIVVPDEWNK